MPRQLRLDEAIEHWSDDQLASLTWMGIMIDDPQLKPRLQQFRDEIDRRGLLDSESVRLLAARIERVGAGVDADLK